MKIITNSENKEISQKINLFFENSDYLSLIVYSQTDLVQKLIQSIDNLCFYTERIEFLPQNITLFIRIGIAYYKLGKYKEAIKNYQFAQLILKNIILAKKEFKKEDSSIGKFYYKIFSEFSDNNSNLISELYSYIAYTQYELYNPIFSLISYNNALKYCKINNPKYIILAVGKADCYYEISKIIRTLVKIIFFSICIVLLCHKHWSIIFTVMNNLFFLLDNIVWHLCLLILLLTFPKILYKLFYFILRKLRKYIADNFIRLFPRPFEKFLKEILNIITFKKFLIYKYYYEVIKDIEKIGNKSFDTFFAIAKLYYFLGEYVTATFYIQKALNYTEINDNIKNAIACHYLARIAYKQSNHQTAINFYDKTIEYLIIADEKKEIKPAIIRRILNIFNKKKIFKNTTIHPIPKIRDMIYYSQSNKDILDKTTFSRTYLPLIITLIITLIISVFDIYSNISAHEKEVNEFFNKNIEFVDKLFIKKEKNGDLKNTKILKKSSNKKLD